MKRNLFFASFGAWWIGALSLVAPNSLVAVVAFVASAVAVVCFVLMVEEYRKEKGLPDASPWQPIDTAPKDGSAILLCQALDVSGFPITGHWFDVFVQVGMWWEGDGWIVYCSQVHDPNVHFTPTHWMPRPDPPSLPQEGQQP